MSNLVWLHGRKVEVRMRHYELNGAVDAIYRGKVDQVSFPIITLVEVFDCTGGGHRGRGDMVFSFSSDSFISLEVVKKPGES